MNPLSDRRSRQHKLETSISEESGNSAQGKDFNKK